MLQEQRTSTAACAQPVLQGQLPAPATGGLCCLASRTGRCVRYRSMRQIFRRRVACATGEDQHLLKEACADLPLETSGCVRYRSTAPSAAAGAQPVLQGQSPAPATGGLRCLATRDRRVRPLQEHHTESCRLRAAFATGAAVRACYRRPALPAALCGRYRSTVPSAATGAQPVLQGHPPAPATGGSVPL